MRQSYAAADAKLSDNSEGFMTPNVSRSGQNVESLKCELASEILRSTGQVRIRATGWSMLPSIHPGDSFLIRSTSEEASSIGDLVLFSRERRLFIHRVVGRIDGPEGGMLITRGDSMSRPDPPVKPAQLLGRVVFVLRDGRLFEPSKTLSLSQRAAAAAARRSHSAARVIVGLHRLRRTPKQVYSCPD